MVAASPPRELLVSNPDSSELKRRFVNAFRLGPAHDETNRNTNAPIASKRNTTARPNE